jgi:hypothetical protein
MLDDLGPDQTGQQTDDGEYDQQFDQGKAALDARGGAKSVQARRFHGGPLMLRMKGF